ncbi:MAG: hypothetical protein J6J33_01725 [Clostridia bacterium]|nr:hypothetical protein [Clostridia bacterium]
MGFLDDLIDGLMGMKVYDDCSRPEGLTEDEELEAMIYLNEQIEKEKKNQDK